MTNDKQPETNRLQLTEYEHRKLAELFAKKWIQLEIEVTKELIIEATTPFWVKWWRKFKKKRLNKKQMNNETKQTAVDRIVNLLNKQGFAPVLTHEEIKLFKEIEKAQHEKTYNQSFMSNFPTFEDYYNATYGGNK